MKGCSCLLRATHVGFVLLAGCAFAQFKTKEAADRCIAAAQDESEVICKACNAG